MAQQDVGHGRTVAGGGAVITIYRMELSCGCPGVQDDPAFTDDDGVAMMRKGDMICGGCWEDYTVLSVCTASEQEKLDHLERQRPRACGYRKGAL